MGLTTPLVLASAEPIFDSERDALHHLELDERTVRLKQVDFVKHGSADAWLVSDIFGLSHARSTPAEIAIEAAKRIQLEPKPNPNEVRSVNDSLVSSLADDDPFWPRWLFFAEKYGAK